MPEQPFDMLTSSNTEAIFDHGLISPPPLEDMLLDATGPFASQDVLGGHPMQNGVDLQLVSNPSSLYVQQWQNMPDLSTSNMHTIASSKHLPPTPNSDTHPGSAVNLEDCSTEDNQSFPLKRTSSPRSESEKTTIPKKAATLSRSAMSGSRSVAKKQRLNADAVVKNEEEDETVGDRQGKDRSREKNKIAAAKCRAKKRDNMEVIEHNHRALSAENSLLKRQEQHLRATVSELRTLALDHQSCSCGVHQYNMLEARKLAQGLGGLCSMPNDQIMLLQQQMQQQQQGLSDVETGAGVEELFQMRSQGFDTTQEPFDMQPSLMSNDFLSMHSSPFNGDQNFLEELEHASNNHNLGN